MTNCDEPGSVRPGNRRHQAPAGQFVVDQRLTAQGDPRAGNRRADRRVEAGEPHHRRTRIRAAAQQAQPGRPILLRTGRRAPPAADCAAAASPENPSAGLHTGNTVSENNSQVAIRARRRAAPAGSPGRDPRAACPAPRPRARAPAIAPRDAAPRMPPAAAPATATRPSRWPRSPAPAALRRVAHRLARRAELGERLLHRRQQRGAFAGDLGAAGAVARPRQQPRPQRVLQPADLVAHRAGADMQTGRGAGETAVPRNRRKGAQGCQGRNPIAHRRSI